MSKTREQLINRVLKEVGAIGEGETGSASDVAAVEDDLDPVLKQLAVREVYPVPEYDLIDDEAFVPLAVLIAASVGRVFGETPSSERILLAESQLRELWNPTVGQDPMEPNYF